MSSDRSAYPTPTASICRAGWNGASSRWSCHAPFTLGQREPVSQSADGPWSIHLGTCNLVIDMEHVTGRQVALMAFGGEDRGVLEIDEVVLVGEQCASSALRVSSGLSSHLFKALLAVSVDR